MSKSLFSIEKLLIVKSLAITIYILFTSTNLYAQTRLHTFEYFLSEAKREATAEQRIAKIDELFLKYARNRFPDSGEPLFLEAVELRGKACGTAKLACLDISKWIEFMCSDEAKFGEIKNRGNTALRRTAWNHMTSGRDVAQVLKHLKKSCTQPQAEAAYAVALDFLTNVSPWAPSEAIRSIEQWIRYTWASTPVSLPRFLDRTRDAINGLNASTPRPLDVMVPLALMSAEWMKSTKPMAESPVYTHWFQSVSGVLVSSGQARIVIAIADTLPIRNALIQNFEFAASMSAPLCAAWTSFGDFEACARHLKELRPRLIGNSRFMIEVDVEAARLTFQKGDADLAEKQMEKVLGVALTSHKNLVPWINLFLAHIHQTQGKTSKAESEVREHLHLIEADTKLPAWLGLFGRTFLVDILREEQRYNEAQAESDKAVKSLSELLRGPSDVAVWIHFDRLKLSISKKDANGVAAASSELRKILIDLPSMAYMGFLVDALVDESKEKSAIASARKLLGNGHPLIKMVTQTLAASKASPGR